MNKHNYPFSDLNVWLGKAPAVNIFLPDKPSLDQVAAACSLASSLLKGGKRTHVVSPQLMKVEFSQVYGVDKVTQKIEGRSLVIEVDYPLEKVEKISWDDRQPKVKLIVQPKAEAPAIDEKMVRLSHQGGKIEKAILLGISSASIWKDLLTRLEIEEAAEAELVVIDIRHEADFGKIRVMDTQASSYSEVIAALIEGLSLPIGEDEANNLLLGLRAATNSFSDPGLGPDAFEAAAFCLRVGGKLKGRETPQESSFHPPKIYRGSDLM